MEERSIYLFISYLNKLRNEEEKINQRKLEKNPKQVIENWRHRFGVPNEDTVDGGGSYNIRLQMWHVYSALITKYNKIFFFLTIFISSTNFSLQTIFLIHWFMTCEKNYGGISQIQNSDSSILHNINSYFIRNFKLIINQVNKLICWASL